MSRRAHTGDRGRRDAIAAYNYLSVSLCAQLGACYFRSWHGNLGRKTIEALKGQSSRVDAITIAFSIEKRKVL